MLLPIPTIKLGDIDRLSFSVEAIDIDVDTIGVRAWQMKWLHAAVLAKIVLRHSAIKGVGIQGLFSG